MPLRVLLVSGRTDIEDVLHDDPGADSYRFERRPPHLVDPAEVARDFPVVLIDFATTPDPVTLGRALRANQRAIEFVPIVPPEQEKLAVDAVKYGAYDYLVWPPQEPADLWTVVARALKKVNPAPALSFPRPFGRYTLIRKLGEGGMAEVFLAEQTATPQAPAKQVVVKRMHDNLAAGEEFVKMFADEARISSSLVHPNIVRVFDFGRIGDSLYIVMEYIPGRNLEELRRGIGGPFPPALACHIVAEICAGLGHAHSRVDKNGVPMSIVHRDVNPPNVLISDDGRVMITDFGIAKAAHRFYETSSGTLKGKFEYMSPEQANGQPVDRRADLFCAGLVLYELLSGTRPFLASTPIETLFLIQQCKPEPPSKFNPRLPPVLDKIVMMALAKDPNVRYQEAGEMERHLREFARRTTNPGPRDIAMFARSVSRQAEIADEAETEERVNAPAAPKAEPAPASKVAAPAPARAAAPAKAPATPPKPVEPAKRPADFTPTVNVPPPLSGREVTYDLGPSEPSITVEGERPPASREAPKSKTPPPDVARVSSSKLQPAVKNPNGDAPAGKEFESSLVDLRQLIVGDITASGAEANAIKATDVSDAPASAAPTVRSVTVEPERDTAPPLPVASATPASAPVVRPGAVVPGGALALPEVVDEPPPVNMEATVIRPLDDAGRPRAPTVEPAAPRAPQPTGSGGELFPADVKAADIQGKKVRAALAGAGALLLAVVVIWFVIASHGGGEHATGTPVAGRTVPPIPTFTATPAATVTAFANATPAASFAPTVVPTATAIVRTTPVATVAPTSVAVVRTPRPPPTARPSPTPGSIMEIPTI
ncbi:MAG TPA: protein kinase, partial [bacterium]|nr:protein kinase [bacterium]